MKQIDEILTPEIDEDACWEKFESEYWDWAINQGWHNEDYVLEQLANGHFYEWLDENVGVDELIYK